MGTNKPTSILVQFSTRGSVRLHAVALDGNGMAGKIGYVVTSNAVELWMRLAPYPYRTTCYRLYQSLYTPADSMTSGGQDAAPEGWTEVAVEKWALSDHTHSYLPTGGVTWNQLRGQ